MYVDLIIWDDENEPHILGPGEVTIEDVEEVIRGHPRSHDDPDDSSDATGLPLIYGDTSSGKHTVVIFEGWSDDDLIIIRPKSAYPVKEYGD
jgi:hypothetical protein